MIKIDANLASRPFVNHRKFTMISGGLLVLLLGISYWNYASYQSTRARRGEVNEQLNRDRSRFECPGTGASEGAGDDFRPLRLPSF